MKRPNWTNEKDSCCSCGHLHATPKDHEKPKEGELLVWQPEPWDPPQWICSSCNARLTADQRRS